MNIDDTSNRLAFLRDDIKHNIEIAKQHDEAGKLARKKVCLQLAEARERFKDNQSFGEWFDASGIVMDKDDRAAAIAMGKDLERLEKALKNTKYTSIRLIYKHDFRVRTDAKTIDKPAKPKTTPELDKALHAYDRRKLAGEDLTYDAIQEEAGLTSSTAVRRAIAMRRAEEQIDKQEELSLSMSAQEKFDAKVRAFRKNFDYEVETAARKLQNEWAEESLQRYSERLTKFERQLVFRPGVMKASEYKTLMLCCHPDTAGNVGDAKRNEATRILTEYRLKLMNEKEDPFVSRHGLPRTREELDRAREEVRARNSARSKAAHAARKQREKAGT